LSGIKRGFGAANTIEINASYGEKNVSKMAQKTMNFN
jgi:hypothetical protein